MVCQGQNGKAYFNHTDLFWDLDDHTGYSWDLVHNSERHEAKEHSLPGFLTHLAFDFGDTCPGYWIQNFYSMCHAAVGAWVIKS